ncbi:discoidin domain-containing protein [Paenibacillus durus]|uniref:F5/8 type C domain-containing protein n=1 Tax=Paenibacillus durus ATCC 35681 TaxID=1333534 RepID=A0A0F7CHE7_PAEDU|nr:discoidin domain-containing protein [Paenibacillus durus]AKG34396.1 hypothetical protein VK70_07260 [Paenibacillus durus ATCC 35681]
MGGYYFQLAEVKAHLSAAATSSSLDGWEAAKLTDGNPGTGWSSHGHPEENGTEWVALDLGSSQMVGGVHMYPRATLGFPQDFKIQFSNDALNWSDIPGQSYTHYVNDGSMHTFTFVNPVIARYVRVYATKLGADDMGNYYFQLNELQIVPSKVAASSSLEGWAASKLIDGNTGSTWSSHGHPEEIGIEWIAIDLETAKNIEGVRLTPRATLSFPKDFKIQSSNDALTWTDIPEQSYSNYVNNGSVQIFNFQTPVNARYLRVYATKLGRDDMGGYYFQLNEVNIVFPASR